MTGPGLAEEFGVLRSLDHPALRHNLPSQATSFVGRTAELAELLNGTIQSLPQANWRRSQKKQNPVRIRARPAKMASSYHCIGQ